MTYWKMPCRARLLFWLTAVYWVVGVTALYASDNPANPVKTGDLFTLPNLIALAGGLISAGTVWQQWQDAQAKIRDLRQDLGHLRDQHIPQTYVRRDVYEEWQEFVEDRLRDRHSVPPPRGGRAS